MRTFYSAVVIFLSSFFLYSCSNSPLKKICINGSCVRAEIADTQEGRRQGLMFRQGLAENQGMLFVFEQEAGYGFWMKNMRFPLDIIWADRNKIIVYIYQGALPCKDICKSLIPPLPTQFVLEVNAGFVAKHRIKIGDSLSF